MTPTSTDYRPLPARWVDEFNQMSERWREVATWLPEGWCDQFEQARMSHDRLIARGQWRSGPASTMGVLGRRHLEVEHSRMLAWLLDSRGHHGLGTRFLEAFRASAGCDPTVEGLERASLTREESRPAGASWRLADVVVRGPNWTLVVENKIWSDQHGSQMDLYVDAYADESAEFVYLTPGGVGARSPRPDVVQAWLPLSWRRDVLPMLRALVHELRVVDPPPRGLAAVEDYVRALEEEL